MFSCLLLFSFSFFFLYFCSAVLLLFQWIVNDVSLRDERCAHTINIIIIFIIRLFVLLICYNIYVSSLFESIFLVVFIFHEFWAFCTLTRFNASNKFEKKRQRRSRTNWKHNKKQRWKRPNVFRFFLYSFSLFLSFFSISNTLTFHFLCVFFVVLFYFIDLFWTVYCVLNDLQQRKIFKYHKLCTVS